MVDARRRLIRALHDHARQHRRERGAAGDPGGPRREPLRAPVDRHRLRADLRGADADRRQACRRIRSPPHLRHRHRDFHRGIALVRSRRHRRDADHGARRPGCRRRADEPRDALDHLRHLPAQAARRGDRDLGWCLGARARDRPARRRLAHRASELALDLLHQRPGRRRRDRGQLPADHGVEGRDAREPRPTRSRHVGSRALRAHLRPDRGERVWLDVGADRRLLRGRRDLAVLVRRDRAQAPFPDARPDPLPQRHLHRRERLDAARGAVDVRRLLLRLALHAKRARLLGGPGRRGVPADDSADHPDRAGRREGVRPLRLALADDDRDGAARRAIALLLPAEHHLRLLESAARLHPRRTRDGDGDDADGGCGDPRRARAQIRRRLGRAERDASGRRLGRDRPHGRDRRRPGEWTPRRRRVHGRLRAGADRGGRHRVPGLDRRVRARAPGDHGAGRAPVELAA